MRKSNIKLSNTQKMSFIINYKVYCFGKDTHFCDNLNVPRSFFR
jgi:hypothetical protein